MLYKETSNITVPFEFVDGSLSKNMISINTSPLVSAMSDDLRQDGEPVTLFDLRVHESTLVCGELFLCDSTLHPS